MKAIPLPVWAAAVCAAVLTNPAPAGDLTLAPRPFQAKVALDAQVVPAGPTGVVIDAKEWEDFTITQILPHGSAVKKGDVMVAFDRKGFERKLDDARRAARRAELAAADARTDLAAFQQAAEIRLATAKRVSGEAADDLEYFNQTRRPAEADEAREKVKRAEHAVAAEKEELKQLLAMYEADDLTDQTEEFILKRQRDQLAATEFALRMQKLAAARTIDTELARQAQGLEKAAKETKIALTAAQDEVPRSVEAKKIETAAAEAAAARAAADLAELEADAAKFELKAPAAGAFYHGVFEDGRWVTGEPVKALVPAGKPSAKRPFATLVPAGCPLKWSARVDEATMRRLRVGLTGSGKLVGADEPVLPVKCESVATRPGLDGLYRIDIAAEFPASAAVVPGMGGKLEFIVHDAPAALVVPRKAVRDGPGGTRQVELRSADGKTETRTVKTGLVQGDELQVLEGLEAGQVVVVPE